MTTEHDGSGMLRLEPVSGPDMGAPAIPPSQFATVGRAAECEVCLLHETVSRRHASLAGRNGRWFISDLGSRHGTFVNGVRLEANAPAALENDDLLRIGPWTFRVAVGPERSRPAATLHAGGVTTERIERVPERELGWAVQQRLNLLIECSAAINAAGTEEALVRAALDAAIAGSGYQRVAWLRGMGESVEVLGFKSAGREDPAAFSFSQSLIREASAGTLARLTEDAPIAFGQSIASLGIHSALCAPIVLGGSVVGYLYFDARGQESPVHPESAGFCQAISRMCGLSMASLKRAELEQRHRRLEADLSTAREAQQLIMPPLRGEIGGVSYAVRMRPGRTVAGDLFDVVALDGAVGGRVAICIGDVTGESIGAGIMMASTQSYLHGALLRHQDAALALDEVNRYLTSRTGMGKFVTMWVGVIDPAARLLRFVDAGHGHWLIKRAGRAEPPPRAGGIPVAIDAAYQYRSNELALAPGDRLILYSDGLLEQRSPRGEQFGLERVFAALSADARSVQDDADALFDAVQRFACTDLLDDDATVAAVDPTPQPPA